MVLRSDKRKHQLVQAWESTTWPRLGLAQSALGVKDGGVKLGFQLVTVAQLLHLALDP